jgi:hypothetical protein
MCDAPETVDQTASQLPALNDLVNLLTKSGLLRWHQSQEESTCGNFNECRKPKQIVMVLGSPNDCG